MSESNMGVELQQAPVRKAESIYVTASRSVMRNPQGRVGVIIVSVFVLIALSAPVIAPYSPIRIFRGRALLPPSSRHLLGTDELGRDILSRVIHGTRVAFGVGLTAVGLASMVGVLSGLIAGYAGGALDSLIMRSWDVVMAFPPILLAVGVVAMLGPGALQAAVALAVINFPRFARLARGTTLSEREKDYVLAARSVGATRSRILFRHILPNLLSTLSVQFALALIWAVLLEATLSFLGLGAQPPYPSWGSMLRNSRAYLRQAPWYAIFPGMAITMLLLGLNLLSDAVRDAFDPTRIRQG